MYFVKKYIYNILNGVSDRLGVLGPKKLGLLTAAFVFTAEYLLMVFSTSVPNMSHHIVSLVDALALTILLLPILYLLLVRPLTLDIERRDMAESSLKDYKGRFRSIYEQSPIAIAVCDSNGQLAEANLACLDLFGVDHIYDVIEFNLFENHSITGDAIKQLQNGEEVQFESEFNFDLIKKLGLYQTSKSGRHFIDARVTPLISKNGNKNGGYLVQVQDITMRKQAEETLRASEERFRSFFEHAPEYCYIVCPEGNILDVNQTALKVLGYERDELVESPITRLYAPDSREKAKKLFKKLKDGGELLNEELTIVTKTGAYRQILLSTGAVKDDCGKLLHSISIQKDITELKRAQEHVARAAKLAALGQLAAGIAHEVNNPLNVILLSMDSVLYNGKALSADIRKALVISKEAAIRAGNIVANILEFARERPRHQQRYNLHDLIDKVLNITSADIRHAKVKVQREYMTTTPQLQMNAIEIQQVFMNIIINAIQAMPEGGTLTIRTAATDEGRKIAIEFIDTGVGISKNTKAKIFDPFFTTKPEGIGTGLGLSISYRILESHGGDIKVHSKVGEGSTFTILYPTDHLEAENHRASLLPKRKHADEINVDSMTTERWLKTMPKPH